MHGSGEKRLTRQCTKVEHTAKSCDENIFIVRIFDYDPTRAVIDNSASVVSRRFHLKSQTAALCVRMCECSF